MCNPVFYSIFIEYVHHLYFRTVSSPQEEIPYPSPPPPCWWLWPYFLSLCTYLFWAFHCMESSSIWPLSGFFHLALRIQVHPCGNIHKHLISFYGWIIFHCMINQVNVYPFINWWAWVLTVILTIVKVWISVYKFLHGHMFLILLGMYLGVDIWIKMFQRSKN